MSERDARGPDMSMIRARRSRRRSGSLAARSPPPSLATAALALDRIFPPNLARYHERSTEIVDANGRLLRAFTTTDGKWRLKTTPDDVDPVYLALLKAYEDSRFALHPGVDPLSVVRATGQLIAHGRIVSGASTLTMQAARLLEPRPRTFVNKVIEAARALQLEWRYSKREVMAIYLTLAPMGGNLEGVRAASLAYFGKEPKQLSAAEAALLVAIPQSPSRRRPERSSVAAQAGRDRVLVRGLEDGVIDRALYDMAISRPVPTQRLAMPMNAPHLATWLAGQSPGAVVPTTIRFQLQSALSQLVADERGQMDDKAQVAMVVIDNRTGGVVAWLGGGDFFGRAGQVDLVRAHRSPGSALKPMIYALAFDDRTLHPESLVEDVPAALQGLAAAQLRPRAPGRRHRAARPAAVAERAGRAGAGEGRPGALPRRPCAPPARRRSCRRAIPATRSAWRSAAPRSRRWRWPASIRASPTAAASPRRRSAATGRGPSRCA